MFVHLNHELEPGDLGLDFKIDSINVYHCVFLGRALFLPNVKKKKTASSIFWGEIPFLSFSRLSGP